MIDLDFTFDAAPWEKFLEDAEDTVSGAQLLTLLEGESEEVFEEAMGFLEQRGILPDLSDLPRSNSGEAAARLRREEQLAKVAIDPVVLEEGDPLRLYLEEIAMIPACGDEQLLAETVAAGNQKAMEQLTNLCLSRVIDLARSYTGWGVLLLDLIQEGSLGLWQAIDRFSGGEFAPYRDWWIHFYLTKAVLVQARAGGVGQKMRTAMEDYRSMDERLLAELGRNPTLEEIAEHLHMTPEETAVVKKMLDNARLLASAKQAPEPEEEELAETQAVEDTAYFQMRQRISDLLSRLEETDRKLLTLRFGLEGGLPMSPEDAGKRLGLTPEEVIAREAAALSLLRSN